MMVEQPVTKLIPREPVHRKVLHLPARGSQTVVRAPDRRSTAARRAMTTTRGDDPRESAEDNISFAEFLSRIRMGDERAAAELVSRYEPALRLEIRMRMKDPKLRRLLEPADVCQSV